MKYRIFLLFGIILVMMGCFSAHRPSDVLPGKKLVPILVDIHLAEAINNQKFNLSMISDSLSEDLYLSICKKYKIDRSVIEKSLLWYGEHTREYIPVYNEVSDILSEMEVKAKNDTLRPVHIGGYDLDTSKTKTTPIPSPKTEAVK
jgi:hypothetical protein